jgi:hypothetical protein
MYVPQAMAPKDLAVHLKQRIALAMQLDAAEAQQLVATGESGKRLTVTASTATPITADGFFLTAAHGVTLAPGKHVIVVCPPVAGAPAQRARAQVAGSLCHTVFLPMDAPGSAAAWRHPGDSRWSDDGSEGGGGPLELSGGWPWEL